MGRDVPWDGIVVVLFQTSITRLVSINQSNPSSSKVNSPSNMMPKKAKQRSNSTSPEWSGAGILLYSYVPSTGSDQPPFAPISQSNNNISRSDLSSVPCFLLGQEDDRFQTWEDFGGGRDKADRSPQETAWREFNEETCQLFSTTLSSSNSDEPSPLNTNDDDNNNNTPSPIRKRWVPQNITEFEEKTKEYPFVYAASYFQYWMEVIDIFILSLL